MYVLVRTDGKYVARRGSKHSYTKDIRQAQTYKTREQAEADRCVGNEFIRQLSLENLSAF